MVYLVINEVNFMFQMTLTQIPNSVISSNYFWDSPRVTSIGLTKETVCVSLHLLPMTNCCDFSLWLQVPLLKSLFFCVQQGLFIILLLILLRGRPVLLLQSPSSMSDSSSSHYENKGRLFFLRTYCICSVDFQCITVHVQGSKMMIKSWHSDFPFLIFW